MVNSLIEEVGVDHCLFIGRKGMSWLKLLIYIFLFLSIRLVINCSYADLD